MPGSRKRVMAAGVFDLLHLGHLHYLEEARRLGDELVVVVATDEMVRRRKHTPIIAQEDRLAMVKGLKPVDDAILGDPHDQLKSVERLKPDIIALGYDDYHKVEELKQRLAERAGAPEARPGGQAPRGVRQHAPEGGAAVTRVAVVDTTFARVDMAREVLEELARHPPWKVEVVRATVPGMKDLPVACKRLLDQGCDLALALAWVGGERIDEQCAHEANLGLQWAQLLTNKHILGVFFHESETPDPAAQARTARGRAREHALNALWMLFAPEELAKRAGTGQRQGGDDVGPLR